MERKTKVLADEGKQEILILREFDIPVDLLFTAYAEATIVEQWMGTKVLKLESRKHGSYQFETRNPEGTVVFKAGGVIHEFSPNKKITRTFEMENASLGVQLELLNFEALTAETSNLTIHVIYESVAHRDQHLKMPFAYGINMAHTKLQEVLTKLKTKI